MLRAEILLRLGVKADWVGGFAERVLQAGCHHTLLPSAAVRRGHFPREAAGGTASHLLEETPHLHGYTQSLHIKRDVCILISSIVYQFVCYFSTSALRVIPSV